MLRAFLFFALLSATAEGQAQSSVKRIKTPENQVQEVKQLDDFYDRFNAERLPNGQKAPDSLKATAARAGYIEKLINSEDSRWQKNAERAKLTRFLKLVCDEKYPLFLDKFDDRIYCIASCGVEYFGTVGTAELLFHRKVTKETHQWVLQGASDSFIDQFKQKLEQRSIVPNSHETNFLSLSNALHAGAPLRSYTDSTFHFDALSAFVFAVDTKLVKFNECERVTIFLTGIKGWAIKIEDFTRDNGNAGWLISDLIETPEEPLSKWVFQNH
ncbi:MAG: hypothetical protein U0X91_04225 [Spirosomataceae bacterium]